MSLLNWIVQLNDDFLIHWANKGLLRRAKKLVQTVDSSGWSISEQRVEGNIESYHLSLAQNDISQIECSCGELTCCAHRLAFILQLQTHLSEKMVSQNHETQGEHVPFSIEPWLITHCDQLESKFRKTTIEQALKYWQQGAKVQWIEACDHGIVHIVLANRDEFDVYLPNILDWSLTQCRCTRNACVHRALAVIAVSKLQGKLAVDVISAMESVDSSQQKQLTALQAWLESVLGEGVHNLLPSRLLQAQMLITELNQVDLPHIARLVTQLCSLLEEALNRAVDLDLAQILVLLSRLQRDILALQQTPLPQAKALLAGEHQRQYHPIPMMALIGVYVEHWGNDTDSRGYRSYFYHRRTGRWYSLVNGRKAGRDINWSSYQAIKHDKCGGYPLQDLMQRETEVILKQSIDGSLTLKDVRCLSDPVPFDWKRLIADPNLALIHQWQRISERYMRADFNADVDTLGWLVTEDNFQIQWNRFSGWGEATVMSHCGIAVMVKFSTCYENRLFNNQLNMLFGRWHRSVNQTYFEALAQVYKHATTK